MAATTPIKALLTLDTAAERVLSSVLKHSSLRRKRSSWPGALAVESGTGNGVIMPPSTPRPLPGGKNVLHYDITGELGAGAMGVVYRAYDTRLKRTVALKFLPPHLSFLGSRRDRFLREAVAASALDHPNIGTVHAIEETQDGQMFIVMTCYEGETLQQRILSGRLPPLEASMIAVQIASGLAEAHRAGIVHRDLKPSNVMVTAQGVAKIIDFGIAKLGGEPDLTEHGALIGTAAYMSPEQALGEPADHRSDLWALGALLYEMLTGKLPFSGENNQAVLYAIVNRPVPRMPGIAPVLQATVQRAMAKRPEERYQSAGDLIRDLEAIDTQRDRSTIFLPAAPVGMPKSGRRPMLWIGLLAFLLVAVSIVAARYAGLWGGVSAPAKYVAVLPFETSGSDPAQQALAVGFAEALSDSLATLEASNRDLLVVKARDLRAQRITDVSAARRAFAVAKALTAHLTHHDGQVRLSLTLVDAARQKPELSATIIEAENRLPEMHRKAMSEAVRMLGLKTRPDNVTPPRGYASWLRGVGFLERYDKPGNIEAAIAEFETALKVSLDPLVLVGLSQAYRIRYEVSKDSQWLEPARTNVSRAIEADKNLPSAYISRGAIRNIERDYKGAVDDFQRALILDARIDEAYRGLARAFEGMGLTERAESEYRKAIDARPGYWTGYNRLGAFYHRRERYREAAQQFRQVVRLTPDSAQGYSNLGGALSALGEWQEARAMLEKAVRITPSFAAYNNLGMLLLRQRSYAEAAKAFDKALELNNGYYFVWANLGAAYAHTPGQIENARDAYRRAAELGEKARTLNPNDAIILSHLANYYAFLGKRSEPHELIGMALSLAPGDAKVLVNAAETYEMLGLREQAVTWLAKALEIGFPIRDIERSPLFEQLLKDSRFRAMLKRLK